MLLTNQATQWMGTGTRKAIIIVMADRGGGGGG